MNGLERDSNARDECQFDLRGIDFADKLHELQLDDNDLNTNVCVDWAMTKKRQRAQLRVRLFHPTGDLFVDHAQPMYDAMLAAGATSVSITEAGAWTTRILQDPAGNEFCLIGPD